MVYHFSGMTSLEVSPWSLTSDVNGGLINAKSMRSEWGKPCAGSKWTNRLLDKGVLSFSAPGTAECRTYKMSRCWLYLWPHSPVRHPKLAEDPGRCSWCGKSWTDGWAEVIEEKLWQCWWLDRSRADFSSVGKSLPGKLPHAPHQCGPDEEAAAAVLAFLHCHGRGWLRATLPAPARKDWSWDMVLWTKGEPKRSTVAWDGEAATFGRP